MLHLVLLLALAVVVVAVLRSSLPRLPERGALLIRPSGELVEQLAGEPIERALNEAQGQSAPQTLLWDLTRAIRAAAKDKRIQALLIDTDDLSGSGQAKLEELAAAIAEFRKSGKKVIARGSYFLQSQYYLAAQADEVYVDPFGFVLLPGFDRYRMYYKEAIETLKVDVHVIRAGKFKSADEPFIRNDMSPEERQESTAYLTALWMGYRTRVAQARHIDSEAINTYANGYTAAVQRAGGDTAGVAKAAGLVTGLKTRAEVEQRMIELVGADEAKHSFHGVTLDDYLRVLPAEHRRHHAAERTVAVVMASGEILDGSQPSGTVGGETTAALLRQAREDNDVKSLVLRIDSPGGSVFASEQIYREVVALRAAGKPVVVSMGDLAASGGYYIGAAADEIFASPNTITGSIGVFATIPTFDRSLAKLGVHVDGVGTTGLAGALRVDRPMSPEVQQVLQTGVNHSYAEFLQRVAAGRHKTTAAVNDIAQGRVWAGSDALRLGLVDRLGGYEDAVHSAAQRAQLGKDYEVRVIEPELTLTEQLLLSLKLGIARQVRSTFYGAGVHAASNLAAQLPLPWRPLAREAQRWERLLSVPNRTLAYCFCAVE